MRASGDVLAANLEPRHAREHALYDTVAQSHAKFKDGNPTAAMDLHKARELFELGRGEGIWMSVAQRVVERGAEQMVPSIMEKTGLSREDAYLIFVHDVQGNLAVNRLLGWRRGPEFAHAQELLGAYSEGGLQAVSSLHDSRCSS